MIIKLLLTSSVLTFLTTNTYAHSVNWGLGELIFLFGLYFLLPFFICYLCINSICLGQTF